MGSERGSWPESSAGEDESCHKDVSYELCDCRSHRSEDYIHLVIMRPLILHSGCGRRATFLVAITRCH